ncbi:MAG: family 16 glycosylhydrolase [Fibrobacter sp.]|nr:family 16 glycosylhydrolase [Fibrobacter sp.]
MKTKFLLSVATLALFAACSDDSSSPTASDATNPTDQTEVNPSAQTPTDSTTQTNPANQENQGQTTDQNQQGQVDDQGNVTDPATQPTDPATDPGTDPIVNPGTDPAVNPGTDPVPDVNVAETPVDPTASVNACRSADRAPVVEPTYAAVPSSGNYAYYGAELSGVEPFKYGRYEACMKMVSIPGSVSSMFLYYDNSWMNGDEPWNEIDIEVLGKGGTMWQSNIITREGDPSIKKNTSSESKPLHEFGFDATEGFHLFAMTWTPEYVSWEIDGVEIRRDELGLVRSTHADADQVNFLTKDQTLRFNLWASKSAGWVGAFTGDELADAPKAQWIDYVRVYSYDTATKTFTEAWTDDFDGANLNRDHWSTGNWEMEKVMLADENVVVENGYCKLLLTRADKAE